MEFSEIYIPLYDVILYLYIVEDSLIDIVVEGLDIRYNEIHGLTIPLPSGNIVCILNNNSIHVGLIAHEAYHITAFVFSNIGEQLTHCEPFAYLLQWTTSAITDFVHALQSGSLSPEYKRMLSSFKQNNLNFPKEIKIC